MVRAGRLSRNSIAVAVVALGLGLIVGLLDQSAAASGHRAVGALPATPPMPDCHLATWINGVTENRTDMAIRVAQTGMGLTNEWCREPADDVNPHASNGWRAGDDTGDTDLDIVYLLDNGDRVLFRARVSKGGPTDVGCLYVEVVRPPRDYVCQAETVGAADNFAFVRFSLLPIRR